MKIRSACQSVRSTIRATIAALIDIGRDEALSRKALENRLAVMLGDRFEMSFDGALAMLERSNEMFCRTYTPIRVRPPQLSGEGALKMVKMDADTPSYLDISHGTYQAILDGRYGVSIEDGYFILQE